MNTPSLTNAAQLTIAIIGVGNIGSAFASQLAQAGHNVTVVARPNSKRLSQLQRDGGIINKAGEHTEMRVSDSLDEQAAYDLVVLTILAHQTEALLPTLQRSQAKCFHFMFNNFTPEHLSAELGDQRCTFGMPFVQALLDDDGKLDLTISAGQKTLHGDQRWVKVFNEAGIPSALEPDMQHWLRCHVPLCIGLESICVSAKRRGGGASWGDAMIVARGMKANFSIIKGLGYRIYPAFHSAAGSLPTLLAAGLLWSISRNAAFRELLASGENECRALIETVALAGGELKPTYRQAVKTVIAMKPRDGGKALAQ